MESRRIEILIVEDNPGDVRLIEEYLRDQPGVAFKITRAVRVADARIAVERSTFAVILLDLDLPDTKGLETLREMLPVAHATPIIVLTGRGERDVALKAIDDGARDCLVKGQFDSEVLGRAIHLAITNHNLQLDLKQQAAALRASEALFRRVIEANVDGIVIVDNDYIIRLANSAAAQILDTKHEEIVGQPFGVVVLAGGVFERRLWNGKLVELRAVVVDWHGGPAKLVSMRERAKSDARDRRPKTALDRYSEAKQLFIEATGLGREARETLLTDVAARDADLAGRVQTLLAHDSEMREARSLGPIGSAEPSLAATDQVGPFRLITEIGRGGQGVVYLAEDSRIQRRVALKILRAVGTIEEKAIQRFKREARAASRVNHPSICTVYEAEVARGIPYIAMRLVEGESLARKIARSRPDELSSSSCVNLDSEAETKPEAPRAFPSEPQPPPSGGPSTASDINRVLFLIEQVARALHVAHEAGVIHRDVKPANIMVTPDGEPVITDFGLAIMSEGDAATLTFSGDLFGTPAYMSPEQIAAQRIEMDRRTDVWSLGVTLYECLTLSRAFDAPTRDKLYQAILTKEPRNIRRLNKSVPSSLASVISTAIAKDRDLRYKTALDLAEDLRRVREGKPVLLHGLGAAPALTRFLLWCSRFVPAGASQKALPLIVLGTSIALLTAVAWIVDHGSRQQINAAFDASVDQAHMEISRRIHAVMRHLRGMTTMSIAREWNAEAFGTLFTRVGLPDSCPGVQSTGFCKRFKSVERDEINKLLAEEHGSDIRLSQKEGKADEGYAVFFVEPLETNRWALGWDMYDERGVRSAAMDAAFEDVDPHVSRRTLLPMDKSLEGRESGVYVFMAVHGRSSPTDSATDNALTGFAYCSILVDRFLAPVSGSGLDERVLLRVFDRRPATPEALLYESPRLPDQPIVRPTSRELSFDKETWTVEYEPGPAFEPGSSSAPIGWIIVGGTAVSLILFVATSALVRARLTAQRLEQQLRDP